MFEGRGPTRGKSFAAVVVQGVGVAPGRGRLTPRTFHRTPLFLGLEKLSHGRRTRNTRAFFKFNCSTSQEIGGRESGNV